MESGALLFIFACGGIAMKKIAFGGLLVAALIIASCASTPSIPEWVRQKPAPDARYTYFVGSSSAKDSATAANDATASLIAGIMQYMGVSVNVSSSAEARASLNDYQAKITQTVKTESKGRLAGFEVVEKYIQKDSKSGQYTVYVLARYETKELQKEKARIEALFQEERDAVAIPEKKGDQAATEGRLIDAIRSYAEAMSASGGSNIENAKIKLERNAKKASELAASLKLTIVSENSLSVPLGSKLPASKVALVSNSGGREQRVAGVPLLVTYPKKLASGRVGTGTMQVFTDTNGIAAFEAPPIDIAGSYRVAIQLDFSSISDLLSSLPSWALPYSDAVLSELSGIVAYLNYKVISTAKNVPMAVVAYLKDPASAGNADPAVFLSSLKETLLKEGFSLSDVKLPFGYQTFADISVLNTAALADVQRFAFALLDIRSITKDSSYFIATVEGSLSVFELASGRILYSATKSAQGMGLSEAEAVSNALKALGNQAFGKDLLSALP